MSASKFPFQSRRAVIFDFDGTLANTFPLVYRILTEYCSAKGRSTPSKAEIEDMRNIDSCMVFDYLGLPRWQAPFAIGMVRAKLKKIEHQLDPFEGISSALASLTEQGWRFFVLSSNTRQTIRRFLDRHQLPHPERLEGGVKFFGKQQRLRKLLRAARLNPAATVLVGDETRDICVGKACNLLTLGVTWGFNTRRLLEEAGASRVIDSPSTIAAELESLLPAPNDANNLSSGSDGTSSAAVFGQ